jgi:ribose 1,5-bisphosphokinase
MTSNGIFIAVVGPSGAGKDSLINWARAALAHDNTFSFPTRVITRPADATENCLSVTVDAFQSALNKGDFALHWQAHGLHYGIPATIKMQLAAEQHVVANISRGTIAAARRAFSRTAIVLISAHAEILQARLQARGRESSADQSNRLLRTPPTSVTVQPDIVIDNNETLDLAGEHFVRGLRQMTGNLNFALGL